MRKTHSSRLSAVKATALKGLCLCLLIALAGSFRCDPVSAQDTVDPALELYYSANAIYNRKQYPLAVPIYKEFLAQHRDHEKTQLARYGLGMCQFAMKEYGEALVEFEALLDASELDAKIAKDRLVLLHAQCLLFTKKNDQALTSLLASVDSLAPGVYRTGVLAAICDLYFSKGDWKETASWAQQLLRAKPSAAQSIRAGYQQGYAYYKLEKLSEAIDVLDQSKAIAQAAKDEAWTTRLGQLLSECHISNRDLDQAAASLQASLPKLKGKEAADARYRLAAIKYARKEWQASREDYESFLKSTDGNNPGETRVREARFRVGRCQVEQKQYGQARQSFQQLVDGNDETSARAILWLGRAFSRDSAPMRHQASAKSLQLAASKPWYERGFPDSQETIVADIDFEHANALMLQATPNWEKASKLLERVQQRRGDYRHLAEVMSQRAICLHKLGEFAKSSELTSAFLKRHSKNETAGDMRFLQAENLFLMKKYDEATVAFRQFAVSHKQHDQRWAAIFRLAQILHYQGDWAESNKIAVPLLEKKLKGRLFSSLAFVVGENYFRLGKWAEAIQPLELFLASKSESGSAPKKGTYVDAALLQLGIALSRIDKKEEALRYLNTLERVYSVDTPHLPLALAESGKLNYELQRMDLARKALEDFVRYNADETQELFRRNSDSQLGRVHYYLGWLDAAAKRHDDAASNFALAVKYSQAQRGKAGKSLEADAALQEAIALVNAKEFGRAAKHLQAMTQKYRDHAQIGLVKYYAGLAYAREKNWKTASSFFQQVAQSHADSSYADKALYEWAWCDREQNRTKDATKRYETLLTKYPSSPLVSKVQSELADLNLGMGDQQAVIARLTQTINTVTDAKLKFDLQYQLATAYFKSKDYEKSAPMFEALIADGKQSMLLPSILFQAGESRLALTETVPARDHFSMASKVEDMPESLAESVLLRLGETQNITGQHAQAQTSYQKFLLEFGGSQWIRNARYGLAYAFEKQEQYEKAIREYSNLLPNGIGGGVKMDKWLVKARYQIGECYFNLQQYDKAIVEFARVDASSRGYPEWQAKSVLEMGRVMLAQGKKTDASDRMKEVMQRFPQTKAAGVAQKYLDEIRSGG